MNITERIIYFTQTKWCIPFRDLHHTVCEVCERVKPICPEIEPNKYLEYFLNNIDFDNIDKSQTKEEGLKNCKVLYFGLDQILKSDIDKAISKFQLNLYGFRFRELVEIQNTLIDLCGLLERESRTNKPGISFAQRFNTLYQSIESKEKLFPIDYQILIREFNEIILNDLLSSYKILNETLNIKFPIPIETKIALHKSSQKINEFRKRYDSEIESLKPFLLSKGLIIPKNAEAFLFWLLDEKYKQESFFPLPEITDIDFIEFSEYRESQFDGIEAQPKNLPQNNQSNFKDIFNPNNNSFQVCIDLLEDLEITNNGVSRLKKGRIGKLTGAITAMKQTLNFFKQDYTDDELIQYFNSYLNSDFKTFSKRNIEYTPSIDDAQRFIKNIFIK